MFLVNRVEGIINIGFIIRNYMYLLQAAKNNKQ